MSDPTPTFRIRAKIWIENDQGKVIFGAGRLSILAAVVRCGSINAAAKSLNMSYRAVWGKIKDSERRLGTPLLVRQVGGTSGGGSELTSFGKRLVTKFAELQNNAEIEAEHLFARYFPSDDSLA